MSGPSAWMPIYVGDYLGKTGRLTTEQHGAYLLLLFDYWRNGPPPNDDAVLSQITRLSRPAWRKMKPTILAFFEIDGGKLIHGRVEQELQKAEENHDRRSERAKKAAEARWGDAPRNATSNARSNATSMPQALHNECSPPSPKKVESSPPSRSPAAKLPDDVRSVMEEGGFVSPPPDLALLKDWYAAGATLNQDILPTVRAVRARLSKAPFKLKVFDGAIREKLAADEAESERLRSISRRYEQPESSGFRA